MEKKIVNDTKLIHLIDKGKLTQQQAADELGVTRQAVHTRLKQIRGRTTYTVASASCSKIIDQKLDVIQELNLINDHTKKILDDAKEDPQLALKAINSIQQQISLAITLYESIYNIDALSNFNEEVLQVLEECDPQLRKTVIERLNARSSLRSAVRFK